MAKKKSGEKKRKEKSGFGRTLALTIILGIFISIMTITLFNLIVSYAYEPPVYENFCKNTFYPEQPINIGNSCNCTFSKELQDSQQQCINNGGIPIYNYTDYGCESTLKECNYCNKDFDNATKDYNQKTFFIFAIIGFLLIVAGLFINILLIQIITLPAGAFLVIEAALKNFNNKLFVIIVFALLIIAAVYLALKKLRLRQH
jgi:hypothetical protein